MKLFYILLLFISFTYAKKDFYYGFINSSGDQISQKRTQDILDGFDIMKNARALGKNGKIDDAYKQIKNFKDKNKIKLLDSDLIILYSELVFKKHSKRLMLEASIELEKAINNSTIYENELAKAYMILIELKLKVNKVKDARYFANIIINNFDNQVIKAYGRIYLAKVYRYKREYKRAIKVLYETLTKTTDILVATIVADELFDIYILDNKKDKAYELISKVLKKNMNYYASDSFLALQKVNRLIKAQMPEFAIEILQVLLKEADSPSSIEDFKFKLANTYMDMSDRTNTYILRAKELYIDILNDFPDGVHLRKSKMFVDEILMREKKIKPLVLSSKYKNSESMNQKILLQELLNDIEDKKYEIILKSKKVYKKISNTITKRFGYESINVIFDEVNISLIKQYLNNNKCFLLKKILKTSRDKTLELLIKDKNTKFSFFECLIEVPHEKVYELLKRTFNKNRDAQIYLYLERMAYTLKKYDEAISFSSKVSMVNNENILMKEFLYRFLILSELNDPILLDKFFNYAYKNKSFIEDNADNPVIIDFYYQYYLYLLQKDFLDESRVILDKLYKKQNELLAHVYSPFVELELAKIEKINKNNNKSLELLLDSLKYSRKIKANDEVRIYYELIRLYEESDNRFKKDEYINKCKSVNNTKNSLYKKMCDEM